MRHQLKRHRISRSHSHRKATLAALSTALIKHKRIKTTEAKAKALRVYVEPLINRAKEDSTHNRREVFRHLQDKYAVTELFGDVADKVANRPGGYTRVVKLGARPGDAAEMAIIELVDYNDVKPEGAAGTRRRRTRRAGRGRGTSASAAPKATAQATATPQTEANTPPAGHVTTAETEPATTDISPTTPKSVDVPETAKTEEPVAEDVVIPVPDRTEPNAEAKEIAEERAEQEQNEQGEDEEKQA